MKEKYCPRCKKYKPVQLWGKNRSTPDGLQRYCKQCYREYMSEYRIRRREQAREEVEKLLNGEIGYRCIGLLAENGDPEKDKMFAYYGKFWRPAELKASLENGLPRGMLLQHTSDDIEVVNCDGELVSIEEYRREIG